MEFLRVIVLLTSGALVFTKINTVTVVPSVTDSLEIMNITNKSVQFVDAIRRKLRKNNDDYVEHQSVTVSTVHGYASGRRSADQPVGPPAPEPQSRDLLKETNLKENFNNDYLSVRRKLGDLEVDNSDDLIETRPKPFGRGFLRLFDQLKGNTRNDVVTTTTPPPTIPAYKVIVTKNPSINEPSIPSNKNRFDTVQSRYEKIHQEQEPEQDKRKQMKPLNKGMEKIMKYMAKNKDLIKDFIRSRQKAQKIVMKTVDNSESQSELKAGEALTQKETIPALRQGVSMITNIPQEEHLDMAPARGAHVHARRLKNRLCQRLVLWPEGPKYDSKGNIYLPKYEVVHKREFPNTKRPKIILPRCCNCCKKSVLGCE